MEGWLTDQVLQRQEARFAEAFEAAKIEGARELYHPEVVYLSPTVRLFDRSGPVQGIASVLDFIQLTIARCENIRYHALEQACLPDGRSSFVRIHFDWDAGPVRLRSNYVVLYRYRDRRIGRQEIYYDPSGQLEKLEPGR